MAKPRIFVSSTYYDLRHIRDRAQSFIEGMGYEPVLFESGDIPFRHDLSADLSCYAEIQLCHMLVLIVGGRYGSPTSEDAALQKVSIDERYKFYNSITSQEYRTAREKDIPIFIFVERDVLAEYRTYKKNIAQEIAYAHVDNSNVFVLLDEIMGQSRNNFVRGFERFDDIADWLRDQWAGLFAELLSRKTTEPTLRDLAGQIAELGQINSALKEYTEFLVRKSDPAGSQQIIDSQDRKIEGARLKRFSQEALIIFLLRSAERLGLQRPAASEAYQRFVSSDSLEDFLQRLNLPQVFRDDFLEKHSAVARRDFELLRQRYLLDTPTDQHSSEAKQLLQVKKAKPRSATTKRPLRARSTSPKRSRKKMGS